MIYIKNKKTYKGEGVYIGRPSIFGNPFTMKDESMRAEVIQQYRQYFYEKLSVNEPFRNEVRRLIHMARIGDLYLICWCSPLACHGDVIKEFIELFLDGRVNISGERYL